MGKLTAAVFDPSCCEGGVGATPQSAQPCGCDEGAGWVCRVHSEIETPTNTPIPKSVAQARKERPMARGLLDYFPDALMEVAHVSFVGNEQHNPGEPLHWAKEKSTDEADTIIRHLIERGKLDTDGLRHSAKVAWRALALLQRELDAEQT